MISQTVEYALRAVVYLASDAPASRTTQELSKVTQVPTAYLAKVLQSLIRAEIVQSRRGIGGGVSLIRAPKELSILDVVNAVEPVKRIKKCPLDLPSHGGELCPLHSRLDAAMYQVEASFQETTLQDLLDDRSGSKPLCDVATKR